MKFTLASGKSVLVSYSWHSQEDREHKTAYKRNRALFGEDLLPLKLLVERLENKLFSSVSRKVVVKLPEVDSEKADYILLAVESKGDNGYVVTFISSINMKFKLSLPFKDISVFDRIETQFSKQNILVSSELRRRIQRIKNTQEKKVISSPKPIDTPKPQKISKYLKIVEPKNRQLKGIVIKSKVEKAPYTNTLYNFIMKNGENSTPLTY